MARLIVQRRHLAGAALATIVAARWRSGRLLPLGRPMRRYRRRFPASPDRRWIAYAGPWCSPTGGIHLVDPAGRHRQRLTSFCSRE